MWRDGFETGRAAGGPLHVLVLAAAVGVRPAAVRARAAREGWWQPYPDVVCPPGVPDEPRIRALAALAQVRGGDPTRPRPVALHRWSAAAAWGVHDGWPTAVQVVVPADRTHRSGRRLEVTRSRAFDDGEVVRRGDLATVAAPWLVRSLGEVADVPRLTDVIVDLAQGRHTTLDAVASDHARRIRYPGRATVAAALDRLDAAGRVDSSFERRMRERLLAEGIALDRGQVAVPCAAGVTVHLDHGIAAIRFGIDDVSMKAHSHRRHLRADARRVNSLATVDDDWRVLHATWDDLGPGWPAFVGLVREVVRNQSLRHLEVPWPRPEDLRTR